MKRVVPIALAIALVLVGWVVATREDRATKKVVVSTRALARYQVVAPGDVKLEDRHTGSPDVLADASAVVGKAVLDPVAKGAVVPRSRLVDPALVQGRVALTVVATASPHAPAAGRKADLVVSPRNETGQGLVLRDVTVLAVRGTSYTVGVTERERQALAPLLGFSDVRVTPPLAP